MKKNWLNMYKKRKAPCDGNDLITRSNNSSLPNSVAPTLHGPLTEVSSSPTLPVSALGQNTTAAWTTLALGNPITCSNVTCSPADQAIYEELRKTSYFIEPVSTTNSTLPPLSKASNSTGTNNFINPGMGSSIRGGSSADSPIVSYQLTYRAVLARKGYLVRNTLGSGSYSKVKKVLNCNETPISAAAIKIVDRLKTPKDYQEKFMPRELEIWPQLKHPNLVALLDHFSDARRVYMLLEFVPGGDALQYIQKNGAVGESLAQRWTKQIIDAVRYLHDRNITHRDLKLENLLIAEDEQIKICDFGFIKRQSDIGELSKTYCGSRSYAAPEILMGRPYDPKKTDAWAIGVILYIFVFGNMPFDETKGTKSMLKEQETMDLRWVKHKNKLSPPCWQLLVRVFTWDFERRPDIKYLQKSPWFASIGGAEDREQTSSDRNGFDVATTDSFEVDPDCSSLASSLRSGSRPCRTLSPLLAAAAAVLADESDMCGEKCCEGVRTMLDGLKPSRSKSETNLLVDSAAGFTARKSSNSGGSKMRSRFRIGGNSPKTASSNPSSDNRQQTWQL